VDAVKRPISASELKTRIEARREGLPFLVYRDAGGEQQLLPLSGEPDRLTVGRASASDLPLPWDSEVSRVHAEFVRTGPVWTLEDDGLSRNGTYVNGERLKGRRRLGDGDVIRIGGTTILFHDPGERGTGTTKLTPHNLPAVSIPPAQKRVLVALCRPIATGDGHAVPATNKAIGEECFLSVDAVKTHLRSLFARFGLEDLPQNEKRRTLVAMALETGAVGEADLA
jgi:hypothetical protein